MVFYSTVVFCSLCLIGLLLQSEQCTASEQSLNDPNVLDLNAVSYDDPEFEKRGGGRFFASKDLKRGGGRAFGFAPLSSKRAGGRAFQFANAELASINKRAGGRAFYGYGSMYPSYPLIYKKALSSDYIPYYLQQQQFKRGGGRAFVSDRFVHENESRQKRAGGRNFPIFVGESSEKRMVQ